MTTVCLQDKNNFQVSFQRKSLQKFYFGILKNTTINISNETTNTMLTHHGD